MTFSTYPQHFRTLKTPSFGNFWPQNPLLRPFLATPLLEVVLYQDLDIKRELYVMCFIEKKLVKSIKSCAAEKILIESNSITSEVKLVPGQNTSDASY